MFSHKYNALDGTEQAAKCYCNLQCVVRTSRTQKHPGRDFYACPRYSNDGNKCKYFAWVDEVQLAPNTQTQTQSSTLPSPPATPQSTQKQPMMPPSQAKRAAAAATARIAATPTPDAHAAVAAPSPSAASFTPARASAAQPPKTPSSSLTIEQRAKRLEVIGSAFQSGSSQPQPPDTPLSARSNSAAKQSASRERSAIIEAALSPSKVAAVSPNYRPLPSIDGDLRKAKSPSPPVAGGSSTSKSSPSSPSKRSYIEVSSDDEEEVFWRAVDGDDSPRPSKLPRQSGPGEDAASASNGVLPGALPDTTMGKGKGKDKQADTISTDPENPFDVHSEAGASESTPPSPIKSRVEEFTTVVNSVNDMVEHVKRLERKHQAAAKSIEHKQARIKELEKQNRELTERNKYLQNIIDGLSVRR